MNASINAVAKRYRYTGKERDEESGLYYHGARYYACWLGRWTAVDPAESKYGGMSPYNYCFNNPVMHSDQDGADPEDGKGLKKYASPVPLNDATSHHYLNNDSVVPTEPPKPIHAGEKYWAWLKAQSTNPVSPKRIGYDDKFSIWGDAAGHKSPFYKLFCQ